MPITDMLSLNAQIYADEISLIERIRQPVFVVKSPGRSLTILPTGLPTFLYPAG